MWSWLPKDVRITRNDLLLYFLGYSISAALIEWPRTCTWFLHFQTIILLCLFGKLPNLEKVNGQIHNRNRGAKKCTFESISLMAHKERFPRMRGTAVVNLRQDLPNHWRCRNCNQSLRGAFYEQQGLEGNPSPVGLRSQLSTNAHSIDKNSC